MNETKIVKMYVDGDMSTYQIAEKFNTYPNKIRRILTKNGISLKSHSQAQKAALKNGRAKHPTSGRKRTKEERVKISSSVHGYWENMPEQERAKRVDDARDRWNSMSEKKRSEICAAAIRGIQLASKEGSKLEKYIREQLTKSGYVIEYHKKGIVPNANLEVDIYLPEIGTAIEIDGPSHFLPIWGEDALSKTIKSDNEKNGLLRYHGVMVLRVAQKRKTLSQKSMRDTWNAIEKELKVLSVKLPAKNNRFKEIEV